MRRIQYLFVCAVLLASVAQAQEIRGKTNVGSFKPPAPVVAAPAALKITVEPAFPTADNTLMAGERATVKVTVRNDGGSNADGVTINTVSMPSLVGVAIPTMLDVGSVAKGTSKTAVIEIVSDKGARSQRAVLDVQASTPSGILSQSMQLNISIKERPVAPVVVASDVTPPTIEILEPVRTVTRGLKAVDERPHHTTNTSSVSIRGVAKDSSGVALVYVNGEEVSFTPTPQGAEFSGTALLAMGKNELEIKVIDRFKNESKIVLVVEREEQIIQGGYYALVIAVQDYQDPSVNALQYPIQDANNLVNVLTGSYTFNPDNVILLKNPNRSSIIKTFDQLARKLTDQDNLLIFYAGHGYWDERLKQGFWLPVDAAQSTRTEWISNGTIRDYIAGMPTKHTLLISDACFSGGIFKTRDAFSSDNPATRELYRLPSRKAMTSGAMKEVPDKSVFVDYLIKRLKDNRDKLLPAESLFASFRQAVINNSPNRQVPQYGEIRETGDEGGDFIFVKK